MPDYQSKGGSQATGACGKRKRLIVFKSMTVCMESCKGRSKTVALGGAKV